MATAGQFVELKALEGFANRSKLPPSPTGERSIGKAFLDKNIYVKTLVDDPPVKASGLRTSRYSELGVLMDEKIKTAMSMSKGGTPRRDSWRESVLESKEIQETSAAVDAKTHQ